MDLNLSEKNQTFFKIASPHSINESPLTTTSQDFPTTPKSSQTRRPQSSTRTSFVENHHTIEERHASLFEPLVPAIRQAPLNQQQYEPTINPSFQQDHFTINPSFNGN